MMHPHPNDAAAFDSYSCVALKQLVNWTYTDPLRGHLSDRAPEQIAKRVCDLAEAMVKERRKRLSALNSQPSTTPKDTTQ